MNDWTRATIVRLWRHECDGDAPEGWVAPVQQQWFVRWRRFIVAEGYGR